MKTRFAKMMVLMVSAGIAFVAFLILRPSPESPLFWALVFLAIAVNLAYSTLSRREGLEYETDINQWMDQVRLLVGDSDFEATVKRDPHFGDYGPDERSQILETLQLMPNDRRDLGAALDECGLDFREP